MPDDPELIVQEQGLGISSPIYGSSWLRPRRPFCTSSSSALTTDGSMAAYLVPWNCSKCIWKSAGYFGYY